ncbi:hypothetical protein [Nocardia implantans]|uniref:Transposase n=1 Tax=Nocardia implantans TaxID=3108168 RepID=A0ABU6AUM4_9NOCA|nr:MULTISPECIES: hypothetical protein [unclassified Nocardia]MBF6192600.1 hypothetical protein [Nocardia beijingensis]MEA3527493.1 hypothetical protein [Nocardia sp. CDC192]MEB3511201.1 hypothetical protein [Nocardia sp. CDC186]
MAAIEQGSADPEIAAEVRGAFAELDRCTAVQGRDGTVPTATSLGLRWRARADEAIADFRPKRPAGPYRRQKENDHPLTLREFRARLVERL